MEKHSIDSVDVDYMKKEVNEVDVQGMVDETVRRVREQSDRIQAAAMPYAEKTRAYAERQPVLFTYLAIFVALSIIPVGFFIGFVLSASLFIIAAAAVAIFACVLGVVVLGACFLLPTLFVTSLVSLFFLSCLLGLFLVHRLYLHITAAKSTNGRVDYDSLSRGVKTWLEETVDRVPPPRFDYSSLTLGAKQEPHNPLAIDPAPIKSTQVKTEK
ncbi:hypothetical protein BD324DRAFT_631465 [Kockovaella imperatae]|uniref:Uncharacterized protein n=1 Tax=Kockovaella imperatae TaxID=4999 RepID=A0A1Y1UF80_9TREE|nr:hypothetical protein BD324DRAFT_631465 [Kockovaella imperatae]ORX35735.1 hypothetical protein BD324DRAFT_631465 [Kockovaella imperatae]